MYDSLKIRFEQTKQFVKKHPTAVACAVTMVVTHKVTRDKDVEALKQITAELMLHEVDRSTMLLDTTSFIDAKGLTKEFIAFAPRMRRD